MDFRVGARVGPFSVSTPVGGRPGPHVLAPEPLEHLVAQARAEGWSVSGYRPGVGAHVVRRLTTIALRATPRGVVMRRVVGTRMTVLLLAVGLLLAAACIVGPYL